MTNYTITVLAMLLQSLLVGTNLALLQFIWMMVTGRSCRTVAPCFRR